jgi:hypothetical protein
MDTYAIQVQSAHTKWYWLEQNQFDAGYLSAGPSISHDTVWFDTKSGASQFIFDYGIKPGAKILALDRGGNDRSEAIVAVRVVKIEAVEV